MTLNIGKFFFFNSLDEFTRKTEWSEFRFRFFWAMIEIVHAIQYKILN